MTNFEAVVQKSKQPLLKLKSNVYTFNGDRTMFHFDTFQERLRAGEMSSLDMILTSLGWVPGELIRFISYSTLTQDGITRLKWRLEQPKPLSSRKLDNHFRPFRSVTIPITADILQSTKPVLVQS